MEAIVIRDFGGPEVLEVADLPVPEPAAGEVLVKVAGSSVNYADLRMRAGERPLPLPFVPGFEVSGTVAALGPASPGTGADTLAVGDAVLSVHASNGYAEYVVVPADMVLAVPEGCDLVEAAALPVAHGVAWMALHHRGEITAGDTVLVHAAAGGVGLAAIQIATAAGPG